LSFNSIPLIKQTRSNRNKPVPNGQLIAFGFGNDRFILGHSLVFLLSEPFLTLFMMESFLLVK